MHALPDVSEIVLLALAEDLGVAPRDLASGTGRGLLARDVTSDSTLAADVTFRGTVVAREALVVAGLPVAEFVWSTLSRAVASGSKPGAEVGIVDVFPLVAEGALVESGTRIAEVSGPARVVLAGERTALNFLMVLSGIATETARWVAAAGPSLAVCDTRKTYPGLRSLSKYAVRVGGGTNHREGLWDMVLVKDNHISAAGDVASAIQDARSRQPGLMVEVEADSVEAAEAAARAGADMILLDNMTDEDLSAAVRGVKQVASADGRELLTEASGGIRFERLDALRATDVDRVSTSALTFARPVDLALDVDGASVASGSQNRPFGRLD